MKAASLVPRMMLSAPSALLILLMVISTASANFIDTSPMLLFSSRHATLLDPQLHSASRAGPAADPREIARALTSDKAALCGTAEQGQKKVENVVLIEIEDFTHSTLSSLSSSHVLRRRALSAPFQLTFQHVSASPGNAARELARQINKACSSQTLLQKLTGGNKAPSRVLRVVLPQRLLEQEDLLAQHLEQYSDDLIIITSAPSLPRVSKRALKGDDDEDGSSDLDRGIFHKYQFFSSGLLLALLITFIILIPIAYFTINLLASIESPEPRPAKDSASSKKNN
ncbi:hypothetical protein IE81DRAFT_326490 [Ceraceosorus guamensis]|uniref:Protein BIG1 n=1 Tax=Ceraceosorus guamensis TaxID=1522189 RepID=A0A316VVL1_9BASI|nr:hypothetical protein IE81DRAFT_326490 [Ceraceosorus guamensis]PWN39485.1 hypothetical protein IE81DRAFT_326490 [Ceraceosorus guamensis]